MHNLKYTASVKYKILYITILIALFACKGLTDEKESTENPNKCTQYACPVHADKTSISPEKCPICNTPMVIIFDSLKVDSLNHLK